MCTTRQWKEIGIGGITPNSVLIIGTRSDGLVVQSSVIFSYILKDIKTSDTTKEIQMTNRVVNAIKQLDSYRNCKCLPNNNPCEVHKPKLKGK